MLKKILISAVAVVALGQNLLAEDYHVYGMWNIGNHHSIYDITGYIDTKGLIEGKKGAEYVIFNDNGTGYIYRVEVNGNPNAHPNVNNQPSAERVFTFVSSSPNTLPSWGSVDEFYVDKTGIYFGSARQIKHWDFDWSNEENNLSNGGLSSETLARNTTTGEWWTATGRRDVYKYNNSTNQWEKQFRYPDLGGWHHDGMEIVRDHLYLSDMTTDRVIDYKLNSTGQVQDTSSYSIADYNAPGVDVEGMGFGPNQHFWMSAGKAYEVGAGKLITSCTQTFNYTTNWTMQRSKCDNIKVPGFDDTIMAKMENGKLVYATADAGAKAWLEGLPCNITVVDELTLKTGEGFWLVGKSDISKTIATGENRNNFVNFTNGAYTFVGFNVPVKLDDKFGTQPVEFVYYYDGGWKIWTHADGTNPEVKAGQGLYVLANDNFSMTIK